MSEKRTEIKTKLANTARSSSAVAIAAAMAFSGRE